MRTLTHEDLEYLRAQVTKYYQAYYSELRSQLDRYESVSGALPDFFKGDRRILTTLAQDGVVISHWPAYQDSYDFRISPERLAKDIASEQTDIPIADPSFTVVDYSPGSDFGTFEFIEPFKIPTKTGGIRESNWTRMEVASATNLSYWENANEARKRAREELRPYISDQFA